MKRSKMVCETPVYKVMLVHDSSFRHARKEIASPRDAAELVREYLEGADREHFVGLYLDSSNKLIAIHTITIGILNSSLVHPREVFKVAYMVNAAGVIVAHNHPSGNPEPSVEDIRITKQLADAGKILGIPLHDHIITMQAAGFTSLAERGLL